MQQDAGETLCRQVRPCHAFSQAQEGRRKDTLPLRGATFERPQGLCPPQGQPSRKFTGDTGSGPPTSEKKEALRESLLSQDGSG